MINKIVVVALIVAFIVCGCNNPDYCDFWEYQAEVPKGASVQDTMNIEATLRTNGYVRVRFVTSHGWSGQISSITVYATRREGVAK